MRKGYDNVSDLTKQRIVDLTWGHAPVTQPWDVVMLTVTLYGHQVQTVMGTVTTHQVTIMVIQLRAAGSAVTM